MERVALTSGVEAAQLSCSGRRHARYPGEHCSVLEADSVLELGRLAALRFLEWASGNPQGVVSLPTGRTPEMFIREVKRLRATWASPETQSELGTLGIRRTTAPPSLSGLRFVQLDEFFPIDGSAGNSFKSYVQREYLSEAFGLSPELALLIDTPAGTNNVALFAGGVDLSLRIRPLINELEEQQAAALRAVDEYCCSYENRIAEMGGIGFFLGGIGPDGHVAFNVRGSDHHSTTRLTQLNYESAAAAAGDLGGIELARKGAVITIGLRTITRRPDCCALAFAAGDAKAAIVASAVLNPPGLQRPLSSLFSLPAFRLLLTRSAASQLPARVLESFAAEVRLGMSPDSRSARGAVIDLALSLHKPLSQLTPADLLSDPRCALLMDGGDSEERCARLREAAEAALTSSLDAGLSSRAALDFVHTAPHHDDIALGYLALAANDIRDGEGAGGGQHTFMYATSGFNAVTSSFAAGALRAAAGWLGGERAAELAAAGAFCPSSSAEHDADADEVLDGQAARDGGAAAAGQHRRVLRCVASCLHPPPPGLAFSVPPSATHPSHPWQDASWLREAACWAAAYYEAQPAGAKDAPLLQQLKGMLREFEVDLLWAAHGFTPSQHVRHLRLGFYKGDTFTEEPSTSRDVAPILALLRSARPAVVTVALDPEGSGPDTHWKVLQAVTSALGAYVKELPEGAPLPRVWGYRNVWYRFHAADAGIIFPTSPSDMAALNALFLSCFHTQRTASFPSPEHDGPFSALAQTVQAQQAAQLRTLLGADGWGRRHSSRRVQAARGALYVVELSVEELQARVRALRCV